MKNEEPDRIEIVSSEKWWSFNQDHVIKLQVRPEKPRGIWAQLSASEKQTLKSFGKPEEDITSEKVKKYIGELIILEELGISELLGVYISHSPLKGLQPNRKVIVIIICKKKKK